jgi:hypothetical protein
MAADHQNLFLEQGSTFRKTLTLKDDSNNPYNLLIYNTVKSQGRKSVTSSNTAIVFTCNIIDASNGVIELYANANTTANISTSNIIVRKLVYDITIANTLSGEVIRTTEGHINIDPSVTR